MRNRSILIKLTMLVFVALLAGACSRTQTQDTTARATDARDTITARALVHFRDTLHEHPATLANGAPSLDSLIGAFGTAVARRDTTALRALALSPAEFAYLYYPDSPMSRKPYELDADLMWMQITSSTKKGMTRLMRVYGGTPFHYVSRECTPVERHGSINVINACRILHVTATRDTALEQLFGGIVERDGTYKFVGYANKL